MATLEISAQTQFSHTGDLLGYQAPNNDPRRDDFDWDSVRIDLSRCTFIRPAGVLWCTIYPLLVAERGIPLGQSHLNRTDVPQKAVTAYAFVSNYSNSNIPC